MGRQIFGLRVLQQTEPQADHTDQQAPIENSQTTECPPHECDLGEVRQYDVRLARNGERRRHQDPDDGCEKNGQQTITFKHHLTS